MKGIKIMKCEKNMMRLYAVTDRKWTGEKTLYEQVEAALKGGVTCVQLREKEMCDDDFVKEANEIKTLCHKYNVPFIINDNVEVAIRCNADGVHIGQDDMNAKEVRKMVGPEMMIGVSTHSVEEAVEAVKNGADYLGVGSMFATSTKEGVSLRSWQALFDICHTVDVPIVAIGGINRDNISKLNGSGADGVALVSAIFSAEDIEGECRELYRISEEMANESENTMKINTALTIAGSDCSGGAGIQADIKTMIMNGVYAMSAITALTAQNTTGVSSISEVTPEFLAEQIDMIYSDIRPDAVKIGMVSDAKLIETIVDRLEYYNATNVVVDPVMVATSGADLMKSNALNTMKERLLPIATLVTPNIPEAKALSGMNIENEHDMENVARYINRKYNCAVLLKGGHRVNDANDLLCVDGELKWFYGKRINNQNTHGTGCTLSSAIASNLAKGCDVETSVQNAKDYISGALAAMLDLGKGSGPMHHGYLLGGK